MHSDHRHPGSSLKRPSVKSFRRTTSTLVFCGDLNSSGLSCDFASSLLTCIPVAVAMGTSLFVSFLGISISQSHSSSGVCNNERLQRYRAHLILSDPHLADHANQVKDSGKDCILLVGSAHTETVTNNSCYGKGGQVVNNANGSGGAYSGTGYADSAYPGD